MLQPARRKYRKEFRGSMGGVATRTAELSYGEYGIKVEACGWLSANEIESARRTITHATKRVGKFFLRVFPHKPIGHKTPGARMGSGKSDVGGYVAVVKPGQILMELSGVSRAVAQEAIRLAGHKLSVKTKFIAKKMTKIKTEKTIANLDELKIKFADIKLKIKAGQEKNSNAHKALKKEIAQILTSTKR